MLAHLTTGSTGFTGTTGTTGITGITGFTGITGITAITDNLKNGNLLTDLLTTSNQEMLAHLKRVSYIYT